MHQSISSDCNSMENEAKCIKLEKENFELQKTIISLNKLIGLQALCDSDDESSSDDVENVDLNRPEVNTNYHQTDGLFAKRYPYITNVSITIFILNNI